MSKILADINRCAARCLELRLELCALIAEGGAGWEGWIAGEPPQVAELRKLEGELAKLWVRRREERAVLGLPGFLQ